MVAATVELPALPAKERKPKARSERIPIYARVKIRNLYVSQGLGHKAIAAETGLELRSVQQVVHRMGLPALRRAQEVSLLKQSDARIKAEQTAILEHIAAASEQHAIKALENTGSALERFDKDAARDSQSYSATAKNLVGIIRDIRRPDSEMSAPGSGPTLNLFFCPVPAVPTNNVKDIINLAENDVKSLPST